MAANAEKPSKRVHLVVPGEVWDDIERIAAERHTTATAVLRGFIKLGILATRIEREPDSALILREGEREQQLLILS